jgi:hypothetical protein
MFKNLFMGKKGEQERERATTSGARMVKSEDYEKYGDKAPGTPLPRHEGLDAMLDPTKTPPPVMNVEDLKGSGLECPLHPRRFREGCPECDEVRFHTSVFEGYAGDGRKLRRCPTHNVMTDYFQPCPDCLKDLAAFKQSLFFCGRHGEWYLKGDFCVACAAGKDRELAELKKADKTSGKTESFVLDSARGIVYGPRQDTYGHASVNFQRIADGWELIVGVKITPLQVGLMMDWLKTSRLLNVQVQHETKGAPMTLDAVEDGFRDKAGYAEATLRAMFETPDGTRHTRWPR